LQAYRINYIKMPPTGSSGAREPNPRASAAAISIALDVFGAGSSVTLRSWAGKTACSIDMCIHVLWCTRMRTRMRLYAGTILCVRVVCVWVCTHR